MKIDQSRDNVIPCNIAVVTLWDSIVSYFSQEGANSFFQFLSFWKKLKDTTL